MKEIEGKNYYSIDEIYEKLNGNIQKEQIREFFENKKLPGRLIANVWYGEEESLEDIRFLEKAVMIGHINFDLSEINLKGRILDIGGGGEGIIGQLKGAQVVAIDLRASELMEAADGDYLKVIMDAKDLKFLNEYFDTVTAFFSLMYVPTSDREIIFKEAYRVLKKRGEFVVWDLIIPEKGDIAKEYYGISLSIATAEKKISTGYAIRWNKQQNYELYTELGKKIGLVVKDHHVDENTFFIRYEKI
ncbi:MAG: class I SAM-dependent methyltransferase [Promethearchaeota archaeon]|nr:MAG: class I SAM-dependent methyltransferase [Candidatus Lokiarchaeota archaeon]